MKIFQTISSDKKSIIAMIHFPPLIGYSQFTGIEEIITRVKDEVGDINNSGAHAILVENNYDIPHREFVAPETAAMMAVLTGFVIKQTRLPVGVSVLWNDFRTALGICAACGAQFIRVPAFVDTVETAYGIMPARAAEVIEYRRKLKLVGQVLVLADVQVKHSKMVDKGKPLSRSVQEAVRAGADGIIVTGKWTGDAPDMGDLRVANKYARGLPVLVGSGSTKENLKDLLKMADAIIVGTAIMKEGKVNKNKLTEYMQQFRRLYEKH